MNQTPTKVCRGCTEELPVTRFGNRKRNPDGLQHYCYDCNYERTQAAEERRRASKTDDELRAERERELESRRKYNDANRDKLAHQRRIARLRAEVPALIEELSLMARCVQADTPEWRKWAAQMHSTKTAEYNVYLPVTREMDWNAYKRFENDPIIQQINEIKFAGMERKYRAYPDGFNRRIKQIVARLDEFDSKELHEAHIHVPKTRDKDEARLTPAERRWLARYFSPSAIQKRQENQEGLSPMGVDILSNLSCIGYERTRHFKDGTSKTSFVAGWDSDVEKPAERERRLLLENQGIRIAPKYYPKDGSEWGGLQQHLNQQKEAAEADRAKKDERNAKMRDYRRKQKVELQGNEERAAARRAYKAQKARDYRARKRAEKAASVDNSAD